MDGGLDPAIHVFKLHRPQKEDVDPRVKPAGGEA
jgi:hypothetical protein